MSSSVDGLVSGLDTSGLISKLMQAEGVQQGQLKKKVGTQSTMVSALQTINTKMAAVQSAAESLTKADSWTSGKVASSSGSISASVTSGALPGTLSFDVKRLATAYSVYSQQKMALTDAVTTGEPLTIIKHDGTRVTLATQPSDGSLQAVVSAINGASGETGVRANAIAVNGTEYQLQLTSTTTGAKSDFTVSGLNITALELTPAQDAQISLGGSGATELLATSPTNTFSGIAAGLTFTISKVETGVNLTVTQDTDSIADKMAAMVDAMNAAKAQITTASAYNAASKGGGPLSGNPTARDLSLSLGNAVVGIVDPTKSLSQIGIQTDRDGKVTFDRAKFLEAYADRPGDIQLLATGFAGRVTDVAKAATDSATGTLTTAIKGTNDFIRTLNDSIADWDLRLATRQAALKKTYSALEVALGKMQQQSSWLAGQIAGLPRSSN